MRSDDPEVLITSRLRLEPLREGHAGEMVSVLAPAELYEFTGGTGPTQDELTRRYRAQVAGPGCADEVWRNWILREVESACAAGFVQATVIGDTADVAWLVAREFQGRGFGVEAAKAMCDWLTSNGVHRITAHIHPGHLASQSIASGVGMTRTGEIDEDGEEVWASPESSL